MSAKPVRLRLSRAKGFRLQKHSLAVNGLPAASVTRNGKGKWGNPYRIGADDPFTCTPMKAQDAVFWHAAHYDPLVSAAAERDRAKIRRELGGKNLACTCKLEAPCHADTLLAIANDLAFERVK